LLKSLLYLLRCDTSDTYHLEYDKKRSITVQEHANSGLRTKELLEMTGISEPTLRRWLRDGQPVPELVDARRDWRGWRTWEHRHVDAIRRYQRARQESHKVLDGAPLRRGERP